VPDDEWPAEEAQQATILADFDPATEWGDRRCAPLWDVPVMLVQEWERILTVKLQRRQEIVFIGAGMDEEAISSQLDSALLSPDEMAKCACSSNFKLDMYTNKLIPARDFWMRPR
jgi:Cobalamin synthesis protein cobW C-terminal domain